MWIAHHDGITVSTQIESAAGWNLSFNLILGEYWLNAFQHNM